MKAKFVWLAIFFVVVFFSFESVKACSCSISSPCLMYSRADVVLIGKIKEVEVKGGAAVHRVQIEKLYDGSVGKSEIEIYTDQLSSCAYSMEKDETYMIFARINEKTGIITTGYCSGTKPLSAAEKEFNYLESLNDAPDGRGYLTGKILEYDARYKGGKEAERPNEIDKVYLESENGKITETKIEADGKYSFTNLKGGRYTISLLAPERLISTGEIESDYFSEKGFRKLSRKVKVLGSGCGASEYYTFYVNGIISGKVLDANGTPLRKMPVTVFRYEDADDMPEKLDKVWTDENGFYAIKGLPPARYLIGFEIGNSLYINSYFAGYLPVYYPNASKKKDAIYLQLGNHEILREKNIRLFPELNKRKITGQVVNENGQPAKNAEAVFYVRRKTASDRTEGGYKLKLDAEGKFELEVYDQTEYWILARVFDSENWETRKITSSSECYKVSENQDNVPTLVVLKKGRNECGVENQ